MIIKPLLLVLLMFLNSTPQDTTNLTASYYSNKFEHRKTASGQIFTQHKFTAATNKYKIGTRLLIINPKNNKSVIVIVNDRTSRKHNNRIDLSKSAFKQIANLGSGLQRVKVTPLFLSK